MSLIEEIGELSMVCAGLKAENAELRNVLRDAATLLGTIHREMDALYSNPNAPRAPILINIAAWHARAATLLNDTSSQQAERGEPQ